MSNVGRDWWATLPMNQPVHVSGISSELLELALDPLPIGSPAVIRVAPSDVDSFAQQVGWFLNELERIAIALFPRWLPGAEALDRPSYTNIEALRALARASASRSSHFRPYFIALAERAFRIWHADATSSRTAADSGAPAETRVAELARVISAAYERDHLALLLDLPPGLGSYEQRALAALAQWICQYASAGVWLVGQPLPASDVRQSGVRIPVGVSLLM